MSFSSFGACYAAIGLSAAAGLGGEVVTLMLGAPKSGEDASWEKALPIEARPRKFFRSCMLYSGHQPKGL